MRTEVSGNPSSFLIHLSIVNTLNLRRTLQRTHVNLYKIEGPFFPTNVLRGLKTQGSLPISSLVGPERIRVVMGRIR